MQMPARNEKPSEEASPVASADDTPVQIVPLDHDVDGNERVWLAPRRRAVLLRGAMAVVLVLLVVVMLASNVLSIGAVTREAFSRLFPASSPTLPPLPENSLYYLGLNVPNEQVMLDGRELRYIPRPGIDEPLKLAPGRHIIAWSAYSFRAQSCTISAPYAFGDTCTFTPYQMKVPRSNLAAHMLQLNETLVTLPSNLRQSLQTVVETTVNGIQSSTIVQPEVSYFAAPRGETTARQPLIAALHFNYDTSASWVSPRHRPGFSHLNI